MLERRREVIHESGGKQDSFYTLSYSCVISGHRLATTIHFVRSGGNEPYPEALNPSPVLIGDFPKGSMPIMYVDFADCYM
jgi:hypothetical protein